MTPTDELIIGASGQVGGHLMDALCARNSNPLGCYLSQRVPGGELLDIRNGDAVKTFLRIARPRIIYLPACLSHVDYCEGHVEESFATNVVGVKNIVDSANDIGAKLVYFSSDYVFDGKNGPYSEGDPANPLSVYGRHKLCAEHYIAAFAIDYAIIRTTVVYGWERQGKNFVQRLLGQLQSQVATSVPEDQIGTPTFAPDLVRATIELATTGAKGLFHVAGPITISRYDFALLVAEVFGFDKDLIRPVPTAALAQLASRPINAGLKIRKAAALLSRPMLAPRAALEAMKSSRPLSHDLALGQGARES